MTVSTATRKPTTATTTKPTTTPIKSTRKVTPVPKTAAPSLTVTFEFEKSTKGTHKFASLDDTSPVAGGIYVQKTAFPANIDPTTATFTVTLDAA